MYSTPAKPVWLDALKLYTLHLWKKPKLWFMYKATKLISVHHSLFPYIYSPIHGAAVKRP